MADPVANQVPTSMHPFKPIFPTCVCTNGSFISWISTAAVLSAAVTFFCTRRYFSTKIVRASIPSPKNFKVEPEVKVEQSVVKKTLIENASYLCTSCGLADYSSSESSVATPNRLQKGPVKMVILVRNDLNMGKGKAAAQCCHAVLAAFKGASDQQPEVLKRWEREGQPKVTLKIDSEEEMIELLKKARSAGIIAESIRDAGRTQVVSGTRTVCAIGPAPASLIDTITGHLKLY